MSDSPFDPPIPSELTVKLSTLTQEQQAFLAGYLWSESQRRANAATSLNGVSPIAAQKRQITVISASASGNAAGVAKKLVGRLEAESLEVNLVSAGSYKARQLPKEDIVIIATSTQGDGEPPEEGVPLHSYLFSKKAPKLDGLSFAVVALGDSSYPQFCQCGIDFDTKLGELGGNRLLDRVDADVDYQAVTDAWIENTVAKLKEVAGGNSIPLAVQAEEAVVTSAFNKENPFTANLLDSLPLVTDDATRIVNHVEIDLDGSGLRYQVGDSLGVLTSNAAEVVDEVLELNGLSGDEKIEARQGAISIRQALTFQTDLNQLTPKFISDYASTADSTDLSALIGNKEKLASYQAWTPVVGLMRDYPQELDAQRLFDGLKPLTPRLYSIASSQEEVGEEVHLCVARVDIEHDKKKHSGSASGLLCSRLEEGDEIEVFVEPNPHFRLPQNNDTPLIMIGPGTGIAPFRAFMQQRRAENAQGKNWLFFGNPHFTQDFLYQVEWQGYVKEGLLDKITLAFSRDQEEKVYVQHRLLENGKEVFEWLEQGAHFYVCGDAMHMAKDVEEALIKIVQEHGGKSEAEAKSYVVELRKAKRYQKDVY